MIARRGRKAPFSCASALESMCQKRPHEARHHRIEIATLAHDTDAGELRLRVAGDMSADLARELRRARRPREDPDQREATAVRHRMPPGLRRIVLGGEPGFLGD